MQGSVMRKNLQYPLSTVKNFRFIRCLRKQKGPVARPFAFLAPTYGRVHRFFMLKSTFALYAMYEKSQRKFYYKYNVPYL